MRTLSHKIYFITLASLLALLGSIIVVMGIHIYDQETLNSIINVEGVLATILKIVILGVMFSVVLSLLSCCLIHKAILRRWQEIIPGAKISADGRLIMEIADGCVSKEINELVADFNHMTEKLEHIATEIMMANIDKPTYLQEEITLDMQKGFLHMAIEDIYKTDLPKGLNKDTLHQVSNSIYVDRFPITAEEVAEGSNLTRVTVRRYLEYLESKGLIISRLKYGTVGRPVKLYDIKPSLFDNKRVT